MTPSAWSVSRLGACSWDLTGMRLSSARQQRAFAPGEVPIARSIGLFLPVWSQERSLQAMLQSLEEEASLRLCVQCECRRLPSRSWADHCTCDLTSWQPPIAVSAYHDRTLIARALLVLCLLDRARARSCRQQAKDGAEFKRKEVRQLPLPRSNPGGAERICNENIFSIRHF